MLIVHGNQREAKAELQREAEPYPNIQMFAVSDNVQMNTYMCKKLHKDLVSVVVNPFYSKSLSDYYY